MNRDRTTDEAQFISLTHFPNTKMKISFVAAFLGTLTLVLAFHVGKVQGQSCSVGWFGDSCQFKCHCKKIKKCGHYGTCPSGYKCESGWFGPKCQYVDLAAEAIKQPEIITLTDGDDNSCFETQLYQSVTLDLQKKFLFTWLRLKVSDSKNLYDISVQLKDGANSSDCRNQRNITVNDHTMDIFCDNKVPVRSVSLTGGGVKSLCSVFVSGGRNVALKQNTTQSTNQGGVASNAVDGNPQGDFSLGFCTHTREGMSDPFWRLEFHSPMRVNKYIIYNRFEPSHPEFERRIQGFIIKSFSGGNEVYSYKDQESLKRKYIIQPDSQRDSVSKVEISLKGPDKILTLCEVEIFGDCGASTFGLKCDRFCSNCAGDCYPSNGHCVFGCKEGYLGDMCDITCPPGTFGLNCLRKCSPQCGGASGCNPVNGTCFDTDCTPGYKGPLCNEMEIKACPPGSFGLDCLRKCSPQCGGASGCNPVNGTCFDTDCTPGYKGPLCNETCPPGSFGLNCLAKCGPYCGGKSGCNYVDGTCIDTDCAPGYKGPLCNETCPHGSFGLNCLRKCSPECGGANGCNHVNGICNDTDCTAGYKGPLCNETCPFGRFGLECLETCSPHCDGDKSCNPIHGECICAPGYKGALCNENLTDLGLKIGHVVTGFTLALISFLCASFLFCERRTQQEHNETHITQMET